MTDTGPMFAECPYCGSMNERASLRCHGCGENPQEHPAGSPETAVDSPWLDWPTFWNDDHSEETWALYPLVPEGRCVSLYAPAKAGKSTILLAACAAAATGRSVFGYPPRPPVDVGYVDLEMTEQDLQQRLLELGYQPEDDMSRLHYALHPRWGPLDTPDGAYGFVEDLKAAGVTVVVIDTYSRAVAGKENDADTTRAFYRLTGTALKRYGIAWLRADHSGKDLTLATRGSSAKLDDVDVVWQLTRGDDGIAIKRTHSRIGWVPAEINLTRQEDDYGVVTYVVANQRGYGQGTKEVARLLDELDASLGISVRAAMKLLREAGQKTRTAVVSDAVRWRKEAGNTLGNAPLVGKAETPSETLNGTHSDQRETLSETLGNTLGATVGNREGVTEGNTPVPTPARPTDEEPEDDDPFQ